VGKAALVVIIVVAVIVVAAAAWFGVGYALTRATGPVVTEDRTVSDFTAIEVDGRGTVIVSIGDSPALSVEAKESVLGRLETEVDGNTLRLHERWSWLGIGPLFDDAEIVYHVTVPSLSAVDLSGSITLQSEGVLEADELSINSSGSSDVTLAVKAVGVSLDTSGSSNITLTGSADILSLDASGSTNVAARELAARVATIHCSGSSNIEVNVSQQLTVNASGSSNVAYLGSPQLDTDISGSGEVRALQ
jgi:hypothetical protein